MTSPARFTRVPPAVAILLLMLVSTASPQSPPAWKEMLPADVEAFSFAPTGAVLVQLKKGLFAADPESGTHLWSRPDVEGFSLVPGTPFAMFKAEGGTTVAGIESGKDRWSFASLGFSTIKGTVHLPQAGLLLVYGVTPQSVHTLVACKYESGERVWTNTSLFADPAVASKASKVEYLSWLLDGESGVVLDPSHDGLIRLDLRTGEPVWRVPEAALPSKGDPLEMIAAGRVALGFYDSGKRVLGINLDDGKVLWARAEKFPRPVFQSASTPAGVLLRGAFDVSNQGSKISWHPYLTLIDPATGATKWVLEKEAFDGRSAYMLEGNTAVAAGKEAIVFHDLATGGVQKTIKMTGFEGGEYPEWLDRAEDGGLLVWSSQNLQKFDSSGKLVHSVYLKAPGASFLSKFGMLALGAMATGLTGYPAYGYSALDAAVDYTKARFRATTNARRYMYIFTEEPGGEDARFALVRVDKETGKDTGRLKFNVRAPSFRLDRATGFVVVEHEGTLAGYRFPPPPEK